MSVIEMCLTSLDWHCRFLRHYPTKASSTAQSICRVVMGTIFAVTSAIASDGPLVVVDANASEGKDNLATLYPANVAQLSPQLGGGYSLVCSDNQSFPDSELPAILYLYAKEIRSFGADGGVDHRHLPLLSRCENLEAVSLGGIGSDDNLGFFSQLHQLKQVSLTAHYDRVRRKHLTEGATTFAKHLKPLRERRDLQAVRIISADLSNDVLSYLSRSTDLRVLWLAGNFDDDGLQHLTKLTKLERVTLEGRFSDAGLRHLATLQNVKYLSLNGTQVRGHGLGQLGRLPKLSLMRFEPSRETETLGSLPQSPSLVGLDLGGEHLSDELIATLPRLSNVQSLAFGGHQVSDRSLSALRQFPNLVELDLLGTSVRDERLRDVATCSSLRTLRLAREMASTAGLRQLGSLPCLEKLDLSFCDLTTVDVSVLVLPKLRSIFFGHIISRAAATDTVARLRKFAPKLENPLREPVSIYASINDSGRMMDYWFLTETFSVSIAPPDWDEHSR